MIELQSVTKRFGNFTGVDRLSFQVRPGEVVGLLGENGAGKTTTMRMMATLLKPTEGEIYVNGYSVRKDSMQVRNQIGLLFGGDVGLYARLTARENIEYFGRLYGLDRAEVAKRIQHLSETLGMEEFLERRVAAFSRGMKQKVAIARALVYDPQVILLDEPTTGLDVTAAHVFHQLITSLRAEDKTILFSSHNLGEVEKLCNRVVILHNGKSCFEGTVPSLRETYQMTDLEEIFMRIVGGGN
ncbi:ABC transporter ATP-binding protein [Brevibacillus ginsengisoli]|uniref:ABC transporter ATP-binding protein n=1 Tax=Brevibacillus ginsengisoli TaxID=363854 RepID=UPI003CF4C52F